MQKHGSNVSQKMSETWSRSSSKAKAFSIRQISKIKGEKNLQASFTRTRKGLRVFDNGVEVTPKPLNHEFYDVIDEKQPTALDTIGVTKKGSAMTIMESGMHGNFQSSSSLVKSSAAHTTVLPPFDETMESLFSTQDNSLIQEEESRAPSPFCLPRYDESANNMGMEKLTVVLKETETMMIFEMPQLTADLNTPEGWAVKEQNDRYEFITVGGGSNRKLANAETQTPKIYMKSRSTYLSREKRQNRGTYVNNWVMHDTYNDPGVFHKIPEIAKDRHKLPKVALLSKQSDSEDKLAEIHGKDTFREAVQVMERIIASNQFIKPQKRFKALIKQDPCDLELKFTYNLELLWIHSYPETKNHLVTSFQWNHVNKNVLAAGYGPQNPENLPRNSRDEKSIVNGFVLIWCMKNPSQPDRIFKFDSPVSSLGWSRNKPNQLVIGFYDGLVRVIDVSKRDLTVLRKSLRENSPTYSPQWQVQWWTEDEHLDNEEQIYTSNQDGGIFCFRTGEDFTAMEMMRIPKIEASIPGVKRTEICPIYDITIRTNPGAVLLRRHPVSKNIYFVGSDEGCVYQCSTNYLNHHVDSFLAHDGQINSLEFSPFCSKLFLTCGADWSARIWAAGLTEPLVTLSTKMACVNAAVWCPKNSTVIATCVNNEICIWDIKRKTYRPNSVMVFSAERISMLEFTENGEQLIAANVAGDIYVMSLEGMPFPPFDQTALLIKSIKKSLITKPDILKKLKNIGVPF